MRLNKNLKPYLAEFFGTFALVLVGTGAIVLDQHTAGGVGHLGISVAFGGVVTAMILLFGKWSGAHINPAVSLGFALNGEMTGTQTIGYVGSQILGAVLASTLLWIVFPANEFLGATLPTAGILKSFLLELWMTFLLMYVILAVSKSQPNISRFTAYAVGAVVGIEAYFGGPFTGASMNPARSIGPAFISGHIEGLWIYIVSTIIGALLALWAWKLSSKSKP